MLDERNEEYSQPTVFMCVTCQSIIGDSFCLKYYCNELNLICLNGCSRITKSESTITDTEGETCGSTYFTLHCQQCNNSIGRLYITTPPKFDAMRDMYSFSQMCISSYKVGHPECYESDSVHPVGPTPCLIGADVKSAKELKIEIQKMQQLHLHLNERLITMEKLMEERQNSSEERKRKRL